MQIAVATALGALIARFFGMSIEAGLVYGIAISVASTVVLLRVLADNDALHTSAGHVAVGWLLVEDLFTVIVLVMLPIVSAQHASGSTHDIVESIAATLAKIGILVAFTLVVGQRVIPVVLGYVARTRSRELFTLTVLVITLGIAVGAAKLFGASMALGAFLAGMVVGQSDFSSRAASEALPLRDAFAVLFFVSMGMLFDPSQLAENAGLTLATLAIILIGKPLAALAVTLMMRGSSKTAFSVAIALAQIGEFSFMLAAAGMQLGIFPKEATQALVAASLVSITLNPLLFRCIGPLTRFFSARREPTVVEPPEGSDAPTAFHRAVVVGYGPVGQSLTALLKKNNVEPTVIELNHETVKTLRDDGVRAVYGDASQRAILEAAGIQGAQSFVLSASGSSLDPIKVAKELNPGLLVIVRATYLSEVAMLKAAGAHAVVSAEGEVALAMTERLLDELGATPEQLDRARDRVRESLVSWQS